MHGWGTLTVAMIAIAAPAGATTRIHACRGPAGTVLYQDAPCPRGQPLLREWIAPDDPVASKPAPGRSSQPASRQGRGAGRRAARAKESSDPCRDAKDRRDAIERRVGLARTYELLTALQREVYDACR